MLIENGIFLIVSLSLALINISTLYKHKKVITRTKEQQPQTTPLDALQLLKDGNQRFADGNMLKRDLTEQVNVTANGQYPYAIVLSCIDSRVSPEQIFDQGIGDIFDVRIAGNIVNEDILGSLEFSCKVGGAKLILVVGHTDCGAIQGAIDNVRLGNLSQMLDKLKPAIETVKYEGEKTSRNYEYVDLVSKQNVLLVIDEIKLKSPLLKQMLNNSEIAVVGGMYDIRTGKVEFY